MFVSYENFEWMNFGGQNIYFIFFSCANSDKTAQSWRYRVSREEISFKKGKEKETTAAMTYLVS